MQGDVRAVQRHIYINHLDNGDSIFGAANP